MTYRLDSMNLRYLMETKEVGKANDRKYKGR